MISLILWPHTGLVVNDVWVLSLTSKSPALRDQKFSLQSFVVTLAIAAVIVRPGICLQSLIPELSNISVLVYLLFATSQTIGEGFHGAERFCQYSYVPETLWCQTSFLHDKDKMF